MKRMMLVVAMLVVIASPGSAFESVNAVFVDGVAPMVMDGNLDDWESIPAQVLPVTHPIEQTRDTAKVVPLGGPQDCTFSFKCFADKKYVYFALIVKDNDVIIGRHAFGKGWLDDSTTLYFDGDRVDTGKSYYDANDGQIKVIGKSPSGVAYIEGLIPFFEGLNVPYFWEVRGVKSGFRQTSDGYITEIALPASILGWDSITAGKQMGANLRVVDMDSGFNPEDVDRGYIWAPDPDHTAHFSARSYNLISFATVFIAPALSSSLSQGAQTTGGASIALGVPDYSEGEVLFKNVLIDLGNSNLLEAEAKLLPYHNYLWIKPLLGYIQLKIGKYRQGVKELVDFNEISNTQQIREYTTNTFLNNIESLIVGYKGEIESDIDNQEMIMFNIYKEYVTYYPDDGEGLYRYGYWASKSEHYEEAINAYLTAESILKANRYFNAKLERARNLFYQNKYSESLEIARNILISTDIPEYQYGAKLIIESAKDE